ncbi:MAG: hypothetical protein LQ346_007824, partial [Caloplaca aetnensis]
MPSPPPPPPPPSGITSIQALNDYLASRSTPTSPTITSITPLTGGTANFVFRLTTTTTTTASDSASGSGTFSKIVKHAEPYIAASSYGNRIPFPVQRMEFEVAALRAVGGLMPPLRDGGCVSVPEVLEYDAPEKVLVMSDGGATTLKAAYESLDTQRVRRIGEELGRWLARLHYSTKETQIGEGGNEVGKRMYRWAYAHLGDVAEKFGLDVGFCRYVDEKYGSLLLAAADDVCVCHGDFWPGNVLLDDGCDDGDGGLTVVDWE